MYRARIAAVAASLLRGRGHVRIKSRDQHSRDLATLGPEVPLGHPFVRTSLVFAVKSSLTRCKAESQVNRPQIQLLQDAGEISAHSPPSLSSTLSGDYHKLGSTYTLLSTVSVLYIYGFQMSCFSSHCIYCPVRNTASCYPDVSSRESLWLGAPATLSVT